ncbi:MAG: ATP-binding cassette domain-containing protein, partial [Candidatus Heimdallarchaeota archaeon]|nr:ATP-binding cassette domain-containing protein [Candidatus Heimdallarchaeota archaeon]
PNDMPPEAKARMENFMKNKNQNNQPMNPFMQMMQNPDQILKMAQNLDSKLKGQGSSSVMSGGGQSQMGSGGSSMGGRGGMPDEMVLNILSNPMISDEIKEQFSPTVKATIKEHIKIQANLTQKGAVIKNLSLKIPAGETIAIVGETGAGKTTLIKLLARFYDIQDGEILIDGINIKKTRKADLRSNIGMVPQDSFLFSGDILSNLFYGFPNGKNRYEVTDKLLEISKFLGLHNFIETMPDGYNTYLLENASNLSVGQRQLIAFARVLMLDPKILVLDEATSSVDPYTESLIQDALEKAKKGRTTIIIAHRLSTIKNAGLIIVLDDGRIIEMGTHDELLTKKGKYAQLVDMQSKDIN